ncbi:MAG: hypothetical protein GC139_00345 [Sideroxydans sp.]|nr:hypothetical protein [Sideroxydans sp.]
MQALLNHPAFQGGLAPFLTALIAAELFQRLRLSGLAIIAGFAVTIYLVSGFAFDPLTASRKIVLLGLLAALLGVLLTWFAPRWLRLVLPLAGGFAAVWMVSRILQHQATPAMLLWGAGCALYAGWQIFWMDKLQDAPLRAGSAGLALGLGTGLAALFGASALLGLFGMALGATAGAFLSIQMLTGRTLPCGRSFTLPLALIAALTACLGVLTAELPWYALFALAAIPLAAKIPVPAKQPLWLQSMLLSALTLACAALAIYLTWRVAGAPPL